MAAVTRQCEIGAGYWTRLLIPLLQGAAMNHWEAALTWRACFSYS